MSKIQDMSKKEQKCFNSQANKLYNDYVKEHTFKIAEYITSKAKQIIKNLMNTNKDEIVLCLYLQQFLDETYFVKCYVIENGNKDIVSLCLLRKCDFDPYKDISKPHTNPYTLYYIYTFKNYRNEQHAYNLLTNIKEETTAFCDCNESINLFNKANYTFLQYDSINKHIAIYRGTRSPNRPQAELFQ